MRMRETAFAAILSSMLASAPAVAGEACRDAILAAAKRHGIPASIGLTVAKVESSGNPLALNIEGWPAWARSPSDGVTAIRKLRASGIRSVDVGCMQINLKHHPQAFPRLEDAFDPSANADYGIRFLKQLHAEKRSWGKAIAAYHSGDPKRQAIYLTKIRNGFTAAR